VGQEGGLQAMQAKRVEDEGKQYAHRFGHQAPAGELLAHPIAKRGELGRAPAHVGDRQTANQALAPVGVLEEEERIVGASARLLPAAPEARAVGLAIEVCFRPAWLIGAQKLAAAAAQGAPGLIVTGSRGAQHDTRALQNRGRIGSEPARHEHQCLRRDAMAS
jgi:hypothetical protein